MRRWIAVAVGAVAMIAGVTWVLPRWQARAVAVRAIPTPAPVVNSPRLADELRRAEAEARGWRHAARGLTHVARLYHANGYFEEAAECYRGLTELEPREARWPHLLANLLAGFGRLDEALPWQERAARLAPPAENVRLRLAEMHLKNNHPAAALIEFDAVLKLYPANPHAMLGRARCDLAQDDWSAARGRLQACVARHPGFSGGWALLASVHEHFADRAAGEQARRTAERMGRFRDFADPWLDDLLDACFDAYQLSVAAELEVDPTRCRALLERACVLAPDQSAYHRQFAKALRSIREFRRAREELEKAVTLAPADAESWAALVELLMEMNEGSAASQAVITGVRHCPQSGYLHFANGNRLSAAGDLAAAENEYRAAKRFQPNESRAYIQLGSIYAQQGRVADGIAEMQAGLAVEPGNARIMVLLAYLYVMQPNQIEAHRMIQLCRARGLGQEDLRGVEAEFRQQFGKAP